MRRTNFYRLAALLALAMSFSPAPAFAQSAMTWVSGVGDDMNTGDRTTPCKTFAGAYSKTATNGQINALDSGGYGTLTINRSLTIDGGKELGSILNSSTTAVNINAGINDVVTLRNLSFDGAGTGLYGVRILGAGTVRIENCVIFGNTTNGIDFKPSNGNAILYIKNSHIYRCNGAGVYVQPATTGNVIIEDCQIEQCGSGIVAAAGAVTVSETTISANTGAGLTTSGTGAIKSFGNNRLIGNQPDGNFTGTAPLR